MRLIVNSQSQPDRQRKARDQGTQRRCRNISVQRCPLGDEACESDRRKRRETILQYLQGHHETRRPLRGGRHRSAQVYHIDNVRQRDHRAQYLCRQSRRVHDKAV